MEQINATRDAVVLGRSPVNPNSIDRKHGRQEGEYCEAEVGFPTLRYPSSISLNVLDFTSLRSPISTPESIGRQSRPCREKPQKTRKHRSHEIPRVIATNGPRHG